MFHEENNTIITGGVLVVYSSLGTNNHIQILLKSGVNRWCKMSGGVIEKTTGDNNEKYFFPRKNFHLNPK